MGPSRARVLFHAMSRRVPRQVLIAAVLASLLLAACGSSDDEGTPKGTVVTDGIGCSIFEVSDEEVPEAPEPGEIGDTVETEELRSGEDGACEIGKLGYDTVDMIGVTGSGVKFVDTWELGRPLSLQPGMLLDALETAMADMTVGDLRTVSIPADQGYGPEGDPATGVGPDEPLFFTVQLTAVTRERTHCAPARPLPEAEGKPAEVPIPDTPPTEVSVDVLEEGEGRSAENGDALTVDYVGVSCASGAQFDSSFDNDRILEIPELGTGLIRGFSEGLLGAKPGSILVIQIPHRDAYAGNPPSPDIAVDDDLVFWVAVRSVEAPDEADDAGDDGADGGEDPAVTIPLED